MPFVSSLLILGGLCLGVGALHLVVARSGHRRLHLWFGLVAVLAAGSAILSAYQYRALSPESYAPLFRLGITVEILCWLAFTRYVIAFSEGRSSRLSHLVTASLLLCLGLNVVLPEGLLFSEMTGVYLLELPWGETIALPEGSPSRVFFLADLAILLMTGFVLWTVRRLWIDGRRRRAKVLGLVAGFLVVTLVHGRLVDLLVLESPYLMPFALTLAAVVMGAELAHDAVRSRSLSLELEAYEKRWSELLEKVDLPTLACSAEGLVEHVNPAFTEATGLANREVAGRPVASLLAKGAPAFDGVGLPAGTSEVVLRGRAGRRVEIHFSTLELQDAASRVTGTVSVGADITDRAAMESGRRDALQQLAELRQRIQADSLVMVGSVEESPPLEGLIGSSDAMHYLTHKIRRVAGSDATVLIEGETGVGKELVASLIHAESERSDAPFVSVNCAALAPTLVESELFGHERGAFTGADRQRKGLFERAHGGTLFLDEIGELPLELQPKLLRVLQEGEFERVGGGETLSCDVRLIVATNRDLAAAVSEGAFREDLYYRLAVYPITVPPLRDRVGDIPVLARHLLRGICSQHAVEIDEVPVAVLMQLEAHPWPGNVRELRNVLERAVLSSADSTLRLPEPLQVPPGFETSFETTSSSSASTAAAEEGWRTLDEHTRDYIEQVLRSTSGQISGDGGAAEILGVHPNTLRSRMKKLGVRFERGSAELKHGIS